MQKIALLLTLIGATMAPSAGAVDVNRCVVDGAVLYTDQPCPGARVVQLQPGASAPDAVERLRRDQDRLDAAAAARRGGLAREAALARIQPADANGALPSEPTTDDPVYDFAYAPYGARANARRHESDRERERRRGRSVIPQPAPTPLRAGR